MFPRNLFKKSTYDPGLDFADGHIGQPHQSPGRLPPRCKLLVPFSWGIQLVQILSLSFEPAFNFDHHRHQSKL